jgi:VWFA-related protein
MEEVMPGFLRRFGTLVTIAALASALAVAQDIPDAPQPKIEPPASNNFPADAPPAPKNSHPAAEPSNTPPGGAPSEAAAADHPEDGIASSRNDLFIFRSRVTFVEVPVTVKYPNGHLVEGLSAKDFAVYEDGEERNLSYFSTEPFPLSVAVIVDTNLPSSTLKKINDTLPALVAAFSEFDEVALYRYGNSVQQVQGFTPSGMISSSALQQLKRTGIQGGVPVTGGPFGVPSINNHPVEPQVPDVQQTPREADVLNDAILKAAQDLSRREKLVRRRVIFVISDGRDSRSNARYEEVRKYLLSQNITVYGLGVDVAAMPVYDKLNRIRVPGFGYGDILSRYVIATGGYTFAEFNQQSIEQAYAKITDEARNQYTLGYNTTATLSSAYHSIDVHVHRQNLEVTAKTGYYSLPPPPANH